MRIKILASDDDLFESHQRGVLDNVPVVIDGNSYVFSFITSIGCWSICG
jgi:hypothetical protein